MIHHSASTVNRSSPPPGNTKNGERPGGWLLLFTVLAEWRIMTNNAYAKNNGDGLLCSILWLGHASSLLSLSRLDACPSAMREGKNFNTHFWAAYAYIRNESRDESISSIFAVSPTTISYKYINYKINNTSIFKTNLPSLTSATLLYSFRRF
jgi:hypothetical protein